MLSKGVSLITTLFARALRPRKLDPVTGLQECTDIDPRGAVCAVPTFEGPDNWTRVDRDYKFYALSFNSTAVNSNDVAIFEPNITVRGNYSINMFTAGCLLDDTCDSRGRVIVSGIYNADGGPANRTEIAQTNNFVKYDEIYNGLVDVADSTFRPRITLAPSSDQTPPLVVQAFAIRANLLAVVNASTTSQESTRSTAASGLTSSDPTSSGESTPLATQNSQSGLSTGAKIGIGVGVAVFVLFLLAGGLLVYRLGKKRAVAGKGARTELDEKGTVNELDAGFNRRGEMDGWSRRLELETQERPVEMDGRPS